MIKVFIIDDSLLIRMTIKKILSDCSEIKIIGEAENPIDAFKEFKNVGLPDVFLLDIEMPKMDGLTFLKKIQEQKPIPTIICSTLVDAGSSKAIESLRTGACDIIHKPKVGLHNSIEDITDEFITKIKAASKSKQYTNLNSNNSSDKEASNKELKPLGLINKIIAVGASTGGVQTLEAIFKNLAPNHAPIVVVQHMPVGFTASFANSLNNICKNSTIKEAKEDDILKQGEILIAKGDLHLEVKRIGLSNYKVVLKDYPKVSSHKPSVDVLFTSVAKEVKQNAVAFILTGMGKDGAVGIKKIKDAGGKTYGQNERTCVVYGMPKVAFEIGGVQKQLALDEVTDMMNKVK